MMVGFVLTVGRGSYICSDIVSPCTVLYLTGMTLPSVRATLEQSFCIFAFLHLVLSSGAGSYLSVFLGALC